MRSLKTQLLFSHMALVIIMTGVMALAVGTFFHLGRSVNRILRDNYDSVIAAQNMKESLERMDSAATFYLAGQNDKARRQYEANWPIFQKWLTVEQHNITEPGEQALADDLTTRFDAYRASVEKLLFQPVRPSSKALVDSLPFRDGAGVGADADRRYYFSTLEPAFLGVKGQVQAILDLNQSAIVRADQRARQEAGWAAWAAVGITAVAFLTAILLARLSIRRMLNPLRTFAAEAEAIGAGDLNRHIDLHRDDEIGTLAVAFNRMTERLRGALHAEDQRRKTEFVSVAAHELRTPVTSLQLSVELLAEEAAGPLTDTQRVIIDAQKRDLSRLQTLMQELLDTARLESGKLEQNLQSVSVRDLVHGAIESLLPQAKNKRLNIEEKIGFADPIRVDRVQITRVLSNLLTNAIRYTPEGGCIEVETSQGERGDVRIAVRDHGAGIPSDYLPRIFERFVQVPGANRSGAGLGLSIADAIVKAHGGSITVESTLGKGSVFTVTLPLHAAPRVGQRD